jgi:anti-sigma B factor antagonist
MRITTAKENEFYIIGIEGDLDASSSIQLDQAIEECVFNKETKIIVDCSQLEYISSAGLGVFMSYIHDFQENNISLVLCQLSEKVRNVFQILGLDELIKIVGTKEEAKAIE